MSVDGRILQTTYYGASTGEAGKYVEEIFDSSDQIGLELISYNSM